MLGQKRPLQPGAVPPGGCWSNADPPAFAGDLGDASKRAKTDMTPDEEEFFRLTGIMPERFHGASSGSTSPGPAAVAPPQLSWLSDAQAPAAAQPPQVMPVVQEVPAAPAIPTMPGMQGVPGMAPPSHAGVQHMPAVPAAEPMLQQAPLPQQPLGAPTAAPLLEEAAAAAATTELPGVFGAAAGGAAGFQAFAGAAGQGGSMPMMTAPGVNAAAPSFGLNPQQQQQMLVGQMMQQQMLMQMMAQSAGQGMGPPQEEAEEFEDPLNPDNDPNRFTGRIKGFYEGAIGGGYGFIDCDAAKFKYGRDVYLHSRQMQGAKVGELVSFTILKNAKGEPQARNVMRAEEAAALKAKIQKRQSKEAEAKRAKHQGLERVTGPEKRTGVMTEEEAKRFQESLRKNRK